MGQGHRSEFPTATCTGQYSLQTPAAGLGFMDLLGLQDFQSFSSLLDGMSTTTNPSILKDAAVTSGNITADTDNAPAAKNDTSSGFLEASEVLNQQPTTPNSSSVSSASNDEQGGDSKPVKEEEASWEEEQEQEQEQDEQQNKTKKHLKPKKTNQKKQREPRFAFMTKSDVDHLEDGYRWRKYGQKAVKNSPFPRSYYRCTTAACNVKKRVERSFSDPSIVVTTYEGQHIHPSPVATRGGAGGGFIAGFHPDIGFSGGGATIPGLFNLPTQLGAASFSSYSHDNYNVNGCLPTSNLSQITPTSSTITYASSFHGQARRLCSTSGGAALLRDNGLLQDIVPSHMRANED